MKIKDFYGQFGQGYQSVDFLKLFQETELNKYFSNTEYEEETRAVLNSLWLRGEQLQSNRNQNEGLGSFCSSPSSILHQQSNLGQVIILALFSLFLQLVSRLSPQMYQNIYIYNSYHYRYLENSLNIYQSLQKKMSRNRNIFIKISPTLVILVSFLSLVPTSQIHAPLLLFFFFFLNKLPLNSIKSTVFDNSISNHPTFSSFYRFVVIGCLL